MYDRKTRNNHFVPQFYLKKFCDGQKLYVLNKKTGRIQEKNTTKTVASKKDLYTLRKKIDKNDIEFCTNIFPPQLITDLDKATLKLLTLFLNDELGKIINMRSLVELLGGNNEVQEYMEKKMGRSHDKPKRFHAAGSAHGIIRNWFSFGIGENFISG